MIRIDRVISSNHLRTAWMALALVLLVSPACTPKKVVYVPPEWQAPRPVAQASPQPTSPPVPASKPTAILKPPAAIKESDIAAPAQAPSSTLEKKPAQAPPQRLASMHLVDQAKASLAQGKADAAIPLLEQAIQVDVHNGDAFFNLARAWRMKGSRQKALQFAQKAEVLFQNDPGKLKQVYLLEADTYKEMGDAGKMQSYRQKASKL